MTFRIPIPAGQLDLDRCLFSGQVFRWAKVDVGVREALRAFECGGAAPEKGTARYVGVDGPNWYRIDERNGFLDVETSATEQDFRRLFRLDFDAVAVQRDILADIPELVPHAETLLGLRLMRPSDPVEVFYCFLCTANNNLRRIMPMVARLAEYGPMMDIAPPPTQNPKSNTQSPAPFPSIQNPKSKVQNPAPFPTIQNPKSKIQNPTRFPSSEVVAGIPESELRQKGFGYRAATIPKAAVEVLRRGGDDWIIGLKEIGYEAAHRELVSIPSIGNKLADCICLYGLHYDEAVPIDTHMWQAACRVFFPQHCDKPLTELRYREVGDLLRDRFGMLAGWAHLYLYYENMLNSRAR